MSAVTYDVTYTEQRNRLTSAFRYLLALPHLIVLGVWGYVAELLAVLQWFVILFTGRRNQGMWDFQRSYLGYHTRVHVRTSALPSTSRTRTSAAILARRARRLRRSPTDRRRTASPTPCA